MASGIPSPVSDQAVVVRGGIATPEQLRKNIAKCEFDGLPYTLSMYSFDGLNPFEVAHEVRRNDPNIEADLPHPRMQHTTAEQIRAVLQATGEGEFLLNEPPPGHHDVYFESNPSGAVLEGLAAAFGGRDAWLRNPVMRPKLG